MCIDVFDDERKMRTDTRIQLGKGAWNGIVWPGKFSRRR